MENILHHKTLLLALAWAWAAAASAQVGEHRSELAVGGGVGYNLSSVAFQPTVPQSQQGGKTAGLTLRYTCEKYFNSVCAIVAEVNYSQMGWKERIWDTDDNPVINPETGLAEEYARRIDYIQVPLLARMGWGRERRGVQLFCQIGPQFGFYRSEEAEYNFDLERPNYTDRSSVISGPDFSDMYNMPVENKFDYGIAGGLGVEFSHPHLGHFLLEGRYYFGLGNIYGNSKADYFGKSNHQAITVKLSYLFDVLKTKNPKIK